MNKSYVLMNNTITYISQSISLTGNLIIETKKSYRDLPITPLEPIRPFIFCICHSGRLIYDNHDPGEAFILQSIQNNRAIRDPELLLLCCSSEHKIYFFIFIPIPIPRAPVN